MPVLEVQFRWNGWSGGPGVSTFHAIGTGASDATDFAANINPFFSGLSNLVPTGLNTVSTGVYRELDPANGHLINIGSLTSIPTANVGTGSAAFAAGAGMCVDWLTSTPATHRLRRGRTYLIPLTANIWQTDGTVNNAIVTEVQGLAAAVLSATAGVFGVWKRPASGGSDGVISPVTGYRVPDKQINLGSRRV